MLYAPNNVDRDRGMVMAAVSLFPVRNVGTFVIFGSCSSIQNDKSIKRTIESYYIVLCRKYMFLKTDLVQNHKMKVVAETCG